MVRLTRSVRGAFGEERTRQAGIHPKNVTISAATLPLRILKMPKCRGVINTKMAEMAWTAEARKLKNPFRERPIPSRLFLKNLWRG